MRLKNHYKFCPETLSYKKVQNSFRSQLIRFLPILSIASAFSIVMYLVVANLYQTPREKNLTRENKKLLTAFASINSELEKLENKMHQLEQADDSIYRSLLGGSPLPQSIRKAGIGGHMAKYNEQKNYNILVKEAAEKIDILQSRTRVQSKSYDYLLNKTKQNKERLVHLPAIIPVKTKYEDCIGSGFGMRKHPILNITRLHKGIDFHATEGTPIYASANGKIKDAKFSTTFGNVVEIDHGFGFVTLYAHLSKFEIKPGQIVKRGDLIGYVGNTGLSSCPHLHYEVHKNGKEIDPINYFFNDLSPKEYEHITQLSNAFDTSMD